MNKLSLVLSAALSSTDVMTSETTNSMNTANEKFNASDMISSVFLYGLYFLAVLVLIFLVLMFIDRKYRKKTTDDTLSDKESEQEIIKNEDDNG